MEAAGEVFGLADHVQAIGEGATWWDREHRKVAANLAAVLRAWGLSIARLEGRVVTHARVRQDRECFEGKCSC